MFHFTVPLLLIIFPLINQVCADTCFYNGYTYTCSLGQTCGSYGRCQGMPTYVLVSLISSCIILLSICIRCCIYCTANRPAQQRNPQLIRVAVHPSSIHNPLSSTNMPPINNTYVVEDAPPSYSVAAAQSPKY